MSRFKRMAPSLVADWARVAAQIRSSCRVAVFLDFDGTLVNIAPLPDQVRLAPATRRVLRRLARHPRVTLVVISGRRRSELRRYIGLPGIRYYGLYGWERSGHSPLPSSALRALRSAQSKLSIHLSSIPGIWVEDKHFSLSVHFLGASPAGATPSPAQASLPAAAFSENSACYRKPSRRGDRSALHSGQRNRGATIPGRTGALPRSSFLFWRRSFGRRRFRGRG